MALQVTRARLKRTGEHVPAGPAIVGVAAVALMACIAVRDPNNDGAYPLCIFRAVTGLDCPGCGSLRALHALTRGDVFTAVDHNLLLVALVPFVVWRWVAWLRASRTTGSGSSSLTPARAIVGLGVLILTFWVVRNLPGVPFLGSGIG